MVILNAQSWGKYKGIARIGVVFNTHVEPVVGVVGQRIACIVIIIIVAAANVLPVNSFIGGSLTVIVKVACV